MRTAALDMLARRRYTTAEITARLRRKGYGEEETAGAVMWLVELKYLDDEAIAGEQAGFLAGQKHWGPARVAARLRARGIGRGAIERAADDAFAEIDLRASARAALKRRFGRTDFAGDGPAVRKRASNFLFRMGFDWDTITSVLKSGDREE